MIKNLFVIPAKAGIQCRRVVATFICVLATASAQAQVTFEQILNPNSQPGNWLSYSRTLDNQRHSPLDQINTENVNDLELAWVWQAKSLEKFEATPLVVDGVLYTVQAPNDVVARMRQRAESSGPTTTNPAPAAPAADA